MTPSFTDPNFLPGRMQTWNVNVEREIGGTGLMVGYFGSHGDRQRIPINLNQFATPGGTVRPYPKLSATSPILPGATLGNITEQTSLGWSDYKGLWVTANRRMTHGLQLSGSYTLSKSTDTNSYDGTLTAQDSTNLADSVGPSDFDVRHRVSVNMSYDLPFKGNRFKDGWQVVVVEQAQTGNPLNIVTNITTITGTATVRPDLIGALPAITPTPVVDPATGAVTSYKWFAGGPTRSAIRASPLPRTSSAPRHRCSRCRTTRPASRTSAIWRRNVIYGPGFGDMDLSIIKNIEAAGQRARAAAARGLQPVQPGEPRSAGPDGGAAQHVVRRDQQHPVPDRRLRIGAAGAVRGEVPVLGTEGRKGRTGRTGRTRILLIRLPSCCSVPAYPARPASA